MVSQCCGKFVQTLPNDAITALIKLHLVLEVFTDLRRSYSSVSYKLVYLSDLLEILSAQDATNDRDKIYALLGLTNR